jgi:hypothetical protein
MPPLLIDVLLVVLFHQLFEFDGFQVVRAVTGSIRIGNILGDLLLTLGQPVHLIPKCL